ncbi:hypothetical protein D3C75_948330 [compost metagenome]
MYLKDTLQLLRLFGLLFNDLLGHSLNWCELWNTVYKPKLLSTAILWRFFEELIFALNAQPILALFNLLHVLHHEEFAVLKKGYFIQQYLTRFGLHLHQLQLMFSRNLTHPHGFIVPIFPGV